MDGNVIHSKDSVGHTRYIYVLQYQFMYNKHTHILTAKYYVKEILLR